MPSAVPDRFPLPASEIAPAFKARLDPWVAGFVGLSPEQAKERLRERWGAIKRPSLVGLRDTLLEFEVMAIAATHSGHAVEAYRAGEEDHPCVGDFWYLPGPMERADIAGRLMPFGLQDDEALREFLFHFGGLAEDTDTAGHFVSAARTWEAFRNSEDSFIDLEDTDGFAEWKDSLMLYHARNGCHILVRRDGAVGWWVIQERMITPFATNLDEFIELLDKHRKISWPFDPYGPDDD